MDHNGNNIPLRGEAPTTLVNSTLGAYDYWAISNASTSRCPKIRRSPVGASHALHRARAGLR